jgi:hypothetical protein
MGDAKQIGWDVKLPLSSAYTVFAIKNEILEEYKPKVHLSATDLAKQIAITLKHANKRKAASQAPEAAKRKETEIEEAPRSDEAPSPKKRKVVMPSSPPPATSNDELWD